MRSVIFLIFALYFNFLAFGQSCLPEGIIFNNQNQLNNFPAHYPDCYEIEGSVVITGSGISDLNGLSMISKIYGGLVIKMCPHLINLSGLDSLEFIGEVLWLYYLDTLSSIKALSNLEYVGGDVEIRDNPCLSSLEGLENLSYLGGRLKISSMNSLVNLQGMGPLTSIPGTLYLAHNKKLNSLLGLDQIESIGQDLWFFRNDSIENFEGLNNLKTIEGELYLRESDGLSSFNGLQNVKTIGGLKVYKIPELRDFSGLDNLEEINGPVEITVNYHLKNFSGLDNVSSINGQLLIRANSTLKSLVGLGNIDAGTIDSLRIENNNMLSLCAVESICNYLDVANAIIEIENNATGCNKHSEVYLACDTLGIEEESINVSIKIYPNPCSDYLYLRYEKHELECQTIGLYSVEGRQIFISEFAYNQSGVCKMDIRGLPAGFYLVKIFLEEGILTHKLLIAK